MICGDCKYFVKDEGERENYGWCESSKVNTMVSMYVGSYDVEKRYHAGGTVIFCPSKNFGCIFGEMRGEQENEGVF